MSAEARGVLDRQDCQAQRAPVAVAVHIDARHVEWMLRAVRASDGSGEVDDLGDVFRQEVGGALADRVATEKR